MKKVLTTIVAATILALPTVAVFAQADEAPEIDIFDTILPNVTNWLFAGLLVIAAIFIIIAAFMFVTAQGDAEKTKTARNFVLYAVIGVLVGFAAKGLVLLVGQVVGES